MPSAPSYRSATSFKRRYHAREDKRGNHPVMYLLALTLPFIAVAYKTRSAKDTFLNVLLLCLGWIGAIIHASYVLLAPRPPSKQPQIIVVHSPLASPAAPEAAQSPFADPVVQQAKSYPPSLASYASPTHPHTAEDNTSHHASAYPPSPAYSPSPSSSPSTNPSSAWAVESQDEHAVRMQEEAYRRAQEEWGKRKAA